MMKTVPKTAALVALLTVTVGGGGARVLAKGHAPIVLAKNDRTLVAPKLPPLTTRAPAKTAAKKPAPAAKPAAKPAATTTEPAPSATATATASDNLDKDGFRAVVQRHLNELRFCYERALVDAPNLSGRFIVRMNLVTEDGVGRVSEAEIVPTDDGYLESLSMQTCVLRAVSRWHLPASNDGQPVTVDYPFVFKSQD